MGRKDSAATKLNVKTTTARAVRSLAYCILGFALVMSSGCEAAGAKSGQPAGRRSGFSATSTPPPAAPVTTNNEPVRHQAATELGPDAAEAIPAATRPTPKPIDAGAKRLVDAIAGSLASSPPSNGEIVQISLNAIRNQSRSGMAEFTAMLDRFGSLLNDAAGGSNLRFTAVTDSVMAYEVQGAAYLATRDGFDVWEMYLSLSSTQRPFTLWQNNGAVWLLRQARPGQPQVLMER